MPLYHKYSPTWWGFPNPFPTSRVPSLRQHHSISKAVETAVGQSAWSFTKGHTVHFNSNGSSLYGNTALVLGTSRVFLVYFLIHVMSQKWLQVPQPVRSRGLLSLSALSALSRGTYWGGSGIPLCWDRDYSSGKRDLIQFHRYLLKAYYVPTQISWPIWAGDSGLALVIQVWQGEEFLTSRLYMTYIILWLLISSLSGKNSKGGNLCLKLFCVSGFSDLWKQF